MRFTGNNIELHLTETKSYFASAASAEKHPSAIYEANGHVWLDKEPNIRNECWLDAIDKRFSGRVIIQQWKREPDGRYRCDVTSHGQILLDGVPLSRLVSEK